MGAHQARLHGRLSCTCVLAEAEVQVERLLLPGPGWACGAAWPLG